MSTATSFVVTYNEDVLCPTAAGADFTYSNSGGVVKNLVGTACASSGETLTITFPTSVTPAYNDTFIYAVPTPETPNTSVYAGSFSSPVFAAAQTVTDDGTGTSPLS
jgi:hypothetical protein